MSRCARVTRPARRRAAEELTRCIHPPALCSCGRSDSPQGWHEPAERRDHVSPGRPPLTVTATGADPAAGPAAASGPAPATPNLITDANLCLSRRYRAAPTQVIDTRRFPALPTVIRPDYRAKLGAR